MGGGSIISGGCGLCADPNDCVKNSMQSWYIFHYLFVFLKLSTVSRVLILRKKMKQIGAWNHNLHRRRPHELEKSLVAVSSRKPHDGSVLEGPSRVLEGAHLICRPGSCRVVEVVRQEGVDQEGGWGPRGGCYTLGGQVWSLTNFLHNLGSLKKMDPLS